jgi:hypothetical protein
VDYLIRCRQKAGRIVLPDSHDKPVISAKAEIQENARPTSVVLPFLCLTWIPDQVGNDGLLDFFNGVERLAFGIVLNKTSADMGAICGMLFTTLRAFA